MFVQCGKSPSHYSTTSATPSPKDRQLPPPKPTSQPRSNNASQKLARHARQNNFSPISRPTFGGKHALLTNNQSRSASPSKKSLLPPMAGIASLVPGDNLGIAVHEVIFYLIYERREQQNSGAAYGWRCSRVWHYHSPQHELLQALMALITTLVPGENLG